MAHGLERGAAPGRGMFGCERAYRSILNPEGAHRERGEGVALAGVEEQLAVSLGDQDVPGVDAPRRAHQRRQHRVAHKHLPRALLCQLSAKLRMLPDESNTRDEDVMTILFMFGTPGRHLRQLVAQLDKG